MPEKTVTTPHVCMTKSDYEVVLRKMVSQRDQLSKSILSLKNWMNSYFPNEENICIIEVKKDIYDMLTRSSV